MASETTSKASCCGGSHPTPVQLQDPVDAVGVLATTAPPVIDMTIVEGAESGAAVAEAVDSCCAGDTQHGYTDHKQDYLRRLRRIEGQVRGLQRMVEEDQYCIDILTQISAATKALESTALRLLDEHLAHCVTNAISAGGQEADDKLAEASAAIARLVRS